jgi:hypothetical protein
VRGDAILELPLGLRALDSGIGEEEGPPAPDVRRRLKSVTAAPAFGQRRALVTATIAGLTEGSTRREPGSEDCNRALDTDALGLRP